MTWLLTDPLTLLVLGALGVLWLLIAAAAALCGAASVLRRCRDGDMEALIDATREDMPDHVPAEWVKEHGR